jgi:tetratricopeptide (TPR) repeat protein
MTLHLATARGPRYVSTTIPMTHAADATWQADFTPKRDYIPGYSIFFFEDGKNRVDNNRWRYWDILNCYGGKPDRLSVVGQARTYTGRLLAPAIQRPPDLPRAISILKEALSQDPQGYWFYPSLWRDELKLGDESLSSYQQVANEIKPFLDAHGNNPFALRQVSDLVATEQKKLPSDVVTSFREAASGFSNVPDPILYGGKVYRGPRNERFISLMQSEESQILSELDYWAVALEKGDLQKKAADYLALAARYPKSFRTRNAFAAAFHCEKQLNDLGGAETVFEKWAGVNPADPYPLLAMAQFYVETQIKLDLAVSLLDNVAAIYSSDQASGRPHYYKRPSEFESIRGRAYLMLNNLPAARADLELAARATPDNADVLYALGKVCEKMGDASQALEAYLAAASVPYVESSAASEAYERLFVVQKLGTRQDAGQRIAARIAENARRAAAEYTPVPYSLPAPKFAFADLAGRRFDNRRAMGKPSLLTFWSPG